MFHDKLYASIIKNLKSKATALTIVVSIVLTIGLGFFMRSAFAEYSASAKNPSLPQVPVVEPLDTPVQEVEVNGTSIRAANFRFENNQLLVDTCFDLPDNGDWIISDASLRSGEQALEYSGSIPMAIHMANTSGKPQRCDTIYFKGLEADTDFSDATFIVAWILAHPREGEVCFPEYLAKYQKALDERNAGIMVECFIEELGGGGMSGVRLASKPASMSQEEAEAILYAYDFYLEVHGISGPWVFPFSLEP